MNSKQRKHYRIGLVLLFILEIIFVIAHALYIYSYNKSVHKITGESENKEISVDIHARGDETSSWIIRDLDLNGIIYDVEIKNESESELYSWTLRMNIKQDCYINQFWNGEVEIHQYVGSKDEVVQRLNLAKYSKDELKVDYMINDTDLLIPLKKGDYIIYHPSIVIKEQPISIDDSVVVGVILYYKDSLDLTDYEMDYTSHKEFTEGIGFFVICILIVAWLFLSAMYFSIVIIYRSAEKEMELRKAGISCMADLYEIIYIINITEDTLTPVGVSEENDEARPKDLGANAQLKNMFDFDSTEEYKDLMIVFADLDTLPKRLEKRNSIAIEYLSKYHGWCRIRYFAMDREEGKPVEKVIFTVQTINEEKKELEQVIEQVEQAKSESRSKSTFLANMSHEIRTPINTILGLDTMILRESTEGSVRRYAKDIKSAGDMLLSIINSILDFSKLEAGKMELVPAEYSLKKLIHDVHIMINTRARQKNLDLVMDISERIPDKLYGDDVRLKQIIINLLTNAIKYTESGSIRLGIYGKESADNNIHLLVSVRDTGMGLKEDEKDKLFERFSRLDENKNRNIEGTGLGMSLVSGLLELMNSQLKVASIYGNGSDFYFEVEQKIIDKTPIGKVDWNEYVEEADEDYTVSFTAPDAKVLVVDDNEMNLMVFENLVRATEIEVDKAGSGQIALNLTNKYKYDIIYMDHMMPEMDGIETFKRIKSQPDGKNKETPIIILTANALQGARDEYEEIGFDAFLAKPIDPDALEENLEKYLPEELIKVGEEKKSVKKEKKPSRSVPQIEGVDVSYALEHVGSLEGVEKVAKQFVKVAISDATELEKYCNQIKFDNDNIDALENYRIKVHAMKTSASLIGALQVYGVAAQLEFAARDKKIQQVIETTPYFVEFWIDMYKKIKEYEDSIQDKTTKGSISNEILNPLLHQLMTSMSAYDVKSADGIITELEKYSVDPEISGKIEELKTAVANIDVDLCNQICGEIIK